MKGFTSKYSGPTSPRRIIARVFAAMLLLVSAASLNLGTMGCVPVYCVAGVLCPSESGGGLLFPPLPAESSLPATSTTVVSPLAVSVAGTLIANESGSYDFGVVQPFASWSVDFQVKNTSDARITLDGVSSVQLSGGVPEITIALQPAATILDPNESTTFRLKFAPTAATTHNDTLSILSADMPGGQYTFSVSGNGQFLGDNWVFYTSNTGAAIRTAASGNPSASFRMRTGAGDGSPNGGKVFLYNSNHNGLVLNTLTSFTYDVYVYQNQSTATIPYLNIFVDLDLNGTFDATDVMLVYSLDSANKDTLNNGLIANTWQTWDPFNDGLWVTRQGGVWNWTPRTTAQIMTAYGTGQIVDPWSIPGTPIGGIQFVVGSSSGGLWTNFSSYLDTLRIGFSGVESTFGF